MDQAKKDRVKQALLDLAKKNKDEKKEKGQIVLKNWQSKRTKAATRLTAAIKRKSEQPFYNKFISKYRANAAPINDASQYEENRANAAARLQSAVKRSEFQGLFRGLNEIEKSNTKDAATILQAAIRRKKPMKSYDKIKAINEAKKMNQASSVLQAAIQRKFDYNEINPIIKSEINRKLQSEREARNKGAIAIQSAIKRRQVQPLYNRLNEIDTLNKQEAAVAIQAAIKRKLSANSKPADVVPVPDIKPKTKQQIDTKEYDMMNIYPNAPIFDRKEVISKAREIMAKDKSIPKIRLNATTEEITRFIMDHNTPLSSTVKEFKKFRPNPVGRPKAGAVRY